MVEYSRKQISKAGDLHVNATSSTPIADLEAAREVITYWRSSHELPLQNAMALAKEKTDLLKLQPVFARRLKRFPAIIAKLKRFQADKMKLINMGDVGGGRVILQSQKAVYKVARELKKTKPFKTPPGRVSSRSQHNDYIKRPKANGYRGVHLNGRFPVSDSKASRIEIQLRTYLQHYWSTAVEIIDLFYDERLKEGEGSENWTAFFKSVAAQFAVMDSITGFYSLSDSKQIQSAYEQALARNAEAIQLCYEAQIYAEKLRVTKKLTTFAESIDLVGQRLEGIDFEGYVLLVVDTDQHKLNSKFFDSDQRLDAKSEYDSVERANASNEAVTVALVSTTAVGGVKEAYPNYFANSKEFVARLAPVLSVNFSSSLRKQLKENMTK